MNVEEPAAAPGRRPRFRRWLRVQLRRLVVDAPRARCPKCHEERLTEWDPALRKFVCDVCSAQWRPRAPGRAPDDAQPAGRV